jgi:vancomycin resistance protein YoaR
VLVASLLATGITLASFRSLEPDRGRTVRGLLLDGTPIAPGDDAERAVRARSERWLEEEVWLEAGPLTERLRRAEVGFRFDVEEAVEALLAIGRSGDALTDLVTRFRAQLGRVRVALRPTLDREALRATIEAIAARFDRAPVGAELDDAGRLVSPPEPGRAIDVDASVEEAAARLEAGERRAELVVQERPAPVDASRFARAREPVIVGSYLTRYRVRGDEGPRAVNVRVAAEALDGAVIPAGGRLSFNERVGPRTPGRGYQVAHVIYDGEMIDGIGGGVCQVASTLHAAAFLAGLPVTEHVPHSRPSAYIPMGLDATVVYPDVDLVLANPLPVPITVRASADGGRMSVELWARARPLEVEWRREILARTSYDERVVEDPAVAPGDRVVSQEGGPGFVLERLRVVRDGRAETRERRTLRYPPTDLVVRVAPGDGSAQPVAPPVPSGEAASVEAPPSVTSPASEPPGASEAPGGVASETVAEASGLGTSPADEAR